MGYATATFDDISSFGGRGLSVGSCRGVARAVGRHTITCLCAVAAVALVGTAATVTAAWLLSSKLASTPQMNDMAFRGPGTFALAAKNPHLTVPEQTARPMAAAPDPTMVAKLTPGAPPARFVPVQPKPATARPVPLPQSRPVLPEIARAPVAEPAPPAPPQVAAVAPLPSVVEKRVASQVTPQVAHNKSIPLPDPDLRTAVYDISARAVYMPSGEKLEAHSGFGEKMDDPRYVNIRMRGPTPPNVYNLTMRESLFHGVRAIRLNPVDESKMYGRDGMLAHPFMLGANGQSNGCVSFKNYDKFLQAFLDGKVDRLVVIPDSSGKMPELAAIPRRAPPRRYAASQPAPEPEPTVLTW